MLGQRAQLRPVSTTSRTTKRIAVQKRDWAHVVDVNKPMKNFHTLVPNLARKVSPFSDSFFLACFDDMLSVPV
jgi:antiviral helicase SKI2